MTTMNDSVKKKTGCDTSEDNSMESFSFTKGYWFYFQDGDNEIAAFGSGWSGKEIIYLNDNPVSEDRSYRFSNDHEFTHKGKHYRVRFKMASFWKAELKCSLFINGQLVEERKKAALVKVGKKSWSAILVFFVIGMVFGFLGAKIAKYFF